MMGSMEVNGTLGQEENKESRSHSTLGIQSISIPIMSISSILHTFLNPDAPLGFSLNDIPTQL